MKKRKLIFITGTLLAGGMFILLQSSFWHSFSLEERKRKVSEKLSDEEKIGDKYTLEKPISDSANESMQDREKEEYKLYMDFLNGEKTTDSGMSINDIIIPKGEPESRYFTEYTFFDSDQDGFQELHVRSDRYYYIIDNEKDELYVWKYLEPQTKLFNNGDFLYQHVGGAPTHYDYQYIKVDKKGETIWSMKFACYDDNVDGQFDERDKYFDKNNEEMSYEEWLEIKQNYIDVGVDRIFWTTLTEEI